MQKSERLNGKIFLSTPSARRATSRHTFRIFCQELFLSTPSARRATASKLSDAKAFVISIHALREEGDADDRPAKFLQDLFLSTPSARRATLTKPIRFFGCSIFLSTPSARRATQQHQSDGDGRGDISIHALREEGDATSTFSPGLRSIFLSTPSARRATPQSPSLGASGLHFYPRPPRGGRQESAFPLE